MRQIRLKWVLLLVVAAFLMGAGMTLRGQAEGAPSQIGRFYLVAAPYVQHLPNSNVAEQSVFKIDTTTGETWFFMTGLDRDQSGKTHGYAFWSSIEGSLISRPSTPTSPLPDPAGIRQFVH